jgi:hypothetical protein
LIAADNAAIRQKAVGVNPIFRQLGEAVLDEGGIG